MRLDETKSKISNLMLKGTMNMRRGNLNRALFYFNDAYEYSIDKKNKTVAAEALYNIGRIYADQGEFEAAREYWNQANLLYIEAKDARGSNSVKRALNSIEYH